MFSSYGVTLMGNGDKNQITLFERTKSTYSAFTW
jgi:hypothetical protein